MARAYIDKTLMRWQLQLINVFVEDWVQSIKKSSTTLSAVFRDASFKLNYRKQDQFLDHVAEYLDAEVRPDDHFAVKAFNIAVAAEKNGCDMTEWKDLMPKLKAIVEEVDAKNAGAWGAAKIARQILQRQV